MRFDIAKVSGIGEWDGEDTASGMTFLVPEGKVFLIVRPTTLEMRCDRQLALKLMEKYESVMESRYFGKGGIEIVPSGQVTEEEIYDLVRLSYNLSREEEK